MCKYSPLEPITRLLIETIRESQPGITLDKITQFDIETDIETTYTFGTILATILDYFFKNKKTGKNLQAESLEIELNYIKKMHENHINSRLKQVLIDKLTNLQPSS